MNIEEIRIHRDIVSSLTVRGFLLDAEEFKQPIASVALGNTKRTPEEKHEAIMALTSLFKCEPVGELKPHVGFYEDGMLLRLMYSGDFESAEEAVEEMLQQMHIQFKLSWESNFPI